jgi:hypothetical protein
VESSSVRSRKSPLGIKKNAVEAGHPGGGLQKGKVPWKEKYKADKELFSREKNLIGLKREVIVSFDAKT